MERGACARFELHFTAFISALPSSVATAKQKHDSNRRSTEILGSSLDIVEVLSGAVDPDIHLFVADVLKSFDTVDRDILDRVLSSLGLPDWFRHDYFEYHSHVRPWFKLAAGLGESWTRDGGIPPGCPLSMMFIVALYLPWCRYLAAQEGVEPQLHADNLKCVSRDPGVLMSTSRAVRNDMRGWIVADDGDKWTEALCNGPWRTSGYYFSGFGRLLWLRGSGWSLPG